MGWRYRTYFKVMPGVRLNVSRRGVSATLGPGPLSVNVGPRGAYVNANLPGSGVFYRERISGAPGSDSADRTARASGSLSTPGHGAALPPEEEAELSPEFERALDEARQARERIESMVTLHRNASEIRSGSTERMTSAHLTRFRDALAVAQGEREELARELAGARPAAAQLTAEHEAWAKGWFLRRVRPSRFAALAAQADEARARIAEFEEQLRLSALAAEITLSPEEADSYGSVRDSFTVLSESVAIWDTTHSRETERVRERTAASHRIERTPVTFALGAADVLESSWRVPHLGNANGGDLYLYPGFVLFRVSKEAFAVIDAKEVVIEYAPTDFLETEGVHRDSKVVGHTWQYVNKSGTPDRRYADNPQIPIARYGTLRIRSAGGLREDYLVSRDAAAERFASAWSRYAVR